VFDPLAGAPGCAGAEVCLAGFKPCITELPLLRLIITESVIEETIKITADQVVALVRTLAADRGPNAVCEPIPPKAAATSALLPLWSSTTMIKKTHTKM